MEISLFAAQYSGSSPVRDASAEASSGFDHALAAAQAPPGPEPPPGPTDKVSPSEKQQTQEPNAQSDKPDLASDKKDAKTDSAQVVQAASVALAALNALPAVAVANTVAGGPAKADADAKVSLKELPTDANLEIAATKADGSQKTDAPSEGTAKAHELLAKKSQSGLTDENAAKPALSGAISPDESAPKAAHVSVANGEMIPEESVAKPEHSQLQPKDADGLDQTPPAKSAVPQSLPTTQGGLAGQNGRQQHAEPDQTAQVQTTAKPEGPSVSAFKLVREISDHVEKLATAKSAENVTVHLQSDDQTNVMVVVKSLRGDVQAKIMTNNEGLKNALQQNKPQLQHSFNAKGMNLSGVSVGMEGHGQKGQPERQGARNIASYSTKPEATTPSARIATSGVDLWI